MDSWYGPEVIRKLAEIYPQLYLRPGEEGAKEYEVIVRKGLDAQVKDLSHFLTSPADSSVPEQTPAGEVRVTTLRERADFELFLQIMAHRCTLKEILPSQGASILDGVINWKRIEAHKADFFAKAAEKGEWMPDWGTEFRRFTSDKKNYTDALIILSAGPYSGIPAEKMGLEEEEWLAFSHQIRKAHECTHFLCRRLYREKIDAVWDELVADAAGLYAAFGKYDRETAEMFLGMKNGVYIDGRLQIYTEPETREETARRIHAVLPEIQGECDKMPPDRSPYELAVCLEERKDELWPAKDQGADNNR